MESVSAAEMPAPLTQKRRTRVTNCFGRLSPRAKSTFGSPCSREVARALGVSTPVVLTRTGLLHSAGLPAYATSMRRNG